MDYTTTYLIANIVELAVWLVFFVYRKDLRSEMLLMSLLFGIAGMFSQYVYTIDWWHPLTITGTRIGIEDFLFGFWIGGIAAVVYAVLFERSFRQIPHRRSATSSTLAVRIVLLSVLGGLIFYGSFYLLGVDSFTASALTLGPFTLLIWWKRPDLIMESVVSGVAVAVIGYVWFLAAEWWTPGWVQHYWYLHNLSGMMFFTAPVEDLAWGFLAGAYIGPLYEFLRGKKLVRIPTRG